MTPGEANELVTALLAGALQNSDTRISIAGEILDIKDFRHKGGIVYFSLQDGKHRFRCQASAELADALGDYLKTGTILECYGDFMIGRPGSSPRVELFVEKIDIIDGQASPRTLLLGELEEQGWLDDKTDLPEFPRRIGLVTSPESESVADFLSVIEGIDDLEIEVVEVSLSSEQSIVDGLKLADRGGYDVLVLTRGGGEGLGLFDNYEIAEAIHNSRTPVVSAVGHHRDWSIADMIADARAATPSEAARLVAAHYLIASEDREDVRSESGSASIWKTATIVLALLLAIILLVLYIRR
jgi:exodeoxyribonuclease VII large subunit